MKNCDFVCTSGDYSFVIILNEGGGLRKVSFLKVFFENITAFLELTISFLVLSYFSGLLG